MTAQNRVKRLYLERMNSRVKKIRKLLAERNWTELRTEFGHVKSTASGFGFPDLTECAAYAEETIPPGEISRASYLPATIEATEQLLSRIDTILIQARQQEI